MKQNTIVIKRKGNNIGEDEYYVFVREEEKSVLACVCTHVGLSSLHDVMLDDLKEILQETEVASSWSI